MFVWCVCVDTHTHTECASNLISHCVHKQESFENCVIHLPWSLQLIADQAGCKPDEICDFELQVCDTQPSLIGGAEKEFIFSGRLDNLCMSFCSLKVRFLSNLDSCTVEYIIKPLHLATLFVFYYMLSFCPISEAGLFNRSF